MEMIIKIVFFVLVVLFFLASLGSTNIKRAYLELSAATILSVLLMVSIKLF